jgi:acetylornithine/N-succinyldiaminopimelate aminotransferase
MGKTGKYFGYQNFKVRPDMITMAKALGNGFPVGAVLVQSEISAKMKSGFHASTFGGNFAACAAGIASLKQLDGKMLEKITGLSEYFKKKLGDLKAIFPAVIRENRVYGLMIGIELEKKYPVKNMIDGLLKKKVLALRAGENVLRLLPPFTVRKEDIDVFCRKLYEVFSETVMK